MGYAHADKSLRGVDKKMKKEDADQLIRCVKECWWRVAILLLIPILLFFVLWLDGDDMDWKFGWSALAAIGSLLAAIAAFVASSTALKIARQEWDKEKEQKGQKALMYKWLFMGEIGSLQASFEAIENQVEKYIAAQEGAELTIETCLYMNDLAAGMSTPLIERHLADLHFFGIQTGRAIAGIIANVSLTQGSLAALATNPAKVTEKKKRIAALLLVRLGMVRQYYAQLDWPVDPSQ